MAKLKPQFTIESYGIYNGWQDNGKSLPKIQHCTSLIPAQVDVEFGIVIRALKAKGQKIYWCIQHPDISDKKGRTMPPFEGQEQIRNNNWQFYLGDTVWLPEHNKVGIWRMSITCNAQIVADKLFTLTSDCLEAEAESRFWKRRGF